MKVEKKAASMDAKMAVKRVALMALMLVASTVDERVVMKVVLMAEKRVVLTVEKKVVLKAELMAGI